MKQGKNILLILSFITIAILLYLQKCGKGSIEIKETVKIDTTKVKVVHDTSFVSKPYAVYLKGKRLPAERIFDTLYLPEQIPDSECITLYNDLRDYLTRSYLYSDTIKNDYGYIAINDTITLNKIFGRGINQNFKIPEVTKTITLVDKRNQFYIGAGLFGNPKEFAAGYELNLSLKTKQDRIIEAGYLQQFNGIGYYKIGYRHKLSFKK